MKLVRSLKAVLVGGSSALVVVSGALPASAAGEVRGPVNALHACQHAGADTVPFCGGGAEPPGMDPQHNETWVRDTL